MYPKEKKRQPGFQANAASTHGVLFLCKGNSCRSQMAEGFLRTLSPDSFEAFSAGSEPSLVHPGAIQVMKEVGIDILAHESKSITGFNNWSFDFVITVCKENECPVFLGKVGCRLAWSFEDPASATGTEEEVLGVFRKVRDEIEVEIRDFTERYV